jgi:hypothetical protein
MRPAQLRKFLAATIDARLPVLITGAPGIGKSDIVTQAAQEAKADIIISHPVVADPTDAKGLPWPEKSGERASFLPFGELADALEAKKPTVWFLDDLGQASPAVQASFMQLILARRINGHALPDHVTFVAATNRRTDRAGVQGILEPVKSRFASIVELEPNLDDWLDWALTSGQPSELMAYLRFRPINLHAFNPTQDLKNSPCPRTWAYAGKFVNMGLDRDIELAAIQGAVGEGAAAEFVGFLQVCRELPSFDGILLDPDKAKIPCTNPAAMFATATGLADRTTVQNFPRVVQYAERMHSHRCDTHKAGLAQFAVLLIRDAWRRKPDVQDTGTFIKLMTGPMGKMIRG